MKLITNESNLNALKIVIASKVTRKSIDIIKDSADNLFKLLKAPKTAPQLILDSGTYIFSSNAAAKFLFPPKDQECSLVNYYLDLESALMQPLTTSCASKARDSVKKCFEDVLTHLDKELSSKPYLAGTEMTVGDAVVWCTLYPIFTDQEICTEFLGQKASLKIWFESVERNTAVQEALKQFPIPKGLSCLDSLVSIQSVKNPSSSSFFPNDSSNSPEKSVVLVTDEEKKSASVSFNTKVKGSTKKKVHPVLPVPGEKNVLITSALPYVNNVPHLGNIIGCVLSGDVFARYCRLRGYNTLYISGTDEYGTATETKALEEGLSPREICDKFFKIHDSIYKWFNINFDFFGRTTTTQQTEICQDIFKKVYDNGFILADSVEQLLCEKCDRYLADRFVEGTCPRCAFVDARGDQCDGCGHLINAVELIAPRCKICKQTPVLRNSKQFFLDLPKIEPMLKAWIEKSWVHWSHNAREISKAWLNDGLKPRCITRDLKWGIPVPLEGFQNKVFYVWFDAPIGYISITKLYTEKWRKWWMPEKETQVDLYQFMAKDNVPFHSVMFPASLLSTKENYVMVNHIFATEYLNYEDGKFSKSRGIGVFGNDAQNTGIPSDVWRFYLLYVRPESQDSSFSWLDLALKHNSELLSVLGNFINRALMFCEKSFKAVTPNIELTDEDCELIALVNREVSGYISVVEKGKLREGIRHLLACARLGNQFMQSSQPWVLIKGSDDEKKRCETVIGLSINLACLLAQLLDPYMPQTADVIRKQLNCPPEVIAINDKFTLLLPPGHKIGKPFPLFAKIEDEQVEKLKSQFSGRQKSDGPSAKETAKTPGQPAENDVSSLEAAVAAQGDLVRKMKADGKSKTEWGPEVTILLDLKSKLAKAKEEVKEGNGTSNPTSQTTATVEEMEDKVKKQGDLVRKLKESGAEKSLWQPEVTVLLDLKKKLAEIKGEPLPPPSGKKNKKK